MITVNVWPPKTNEVFGKKVEHPIFGPILSEARGGNVGHANFILELDERSDIYHDVEKGLPELEKIKSLRIVPEVMQGPRGEYLGTKYLNSVKLEQSKWPKDTPSVSSIFKDCLHLMHLGRPSKGVKAEFSSHRIDMEREDISNNTSIIEHHKTQADSLQAEKWSNLTLAIAASELSAALEKRRRLESELRYARAGFARAKIQLSNLSTNCKRELDAAKKIVVEFNKEFFNYQKEINHFCEDLASLQKISNPDLTTSQNVKTNKLRLDFLLDQVKLKKDLENDLEKIDQIAQSKLIPLQRKKDQLGAKIIKLEQAIKELDKMIVNRNEVDVKGLQEAYKKGVDRLLRKQNHDQERKVTRGIHPEYTICLPISDSGLDFYIDEEAVVQAMQEERQKNYSLLSNNCVTSVKRCLLAGISEELKENLVENGVPDSFFKLGRLETCDSLRSWVKRLQIELDKLNYPSYSPLTQASLGG